MIYTLFNFAEASTSVPPTIQIDTIQGIIAIVVFLVGLGVAWGTLGTSVKGIKADVGGLKDDMKDIRERFANLEGRSSGLFKSQSPVNLTPFGDKALTESGLKTYIEENQEILMQVCEEAHDMSTSYDVQESVFEFMNEYKFPDATENAMKTYAFDHGLTMDNMRRVAALHLRNLILGIKGYDPEDIDKNDKKKK